MKKIGYLFFILLLACNNVKSIYRNNDLNLNDKSLQNVLKVAKAEDRNRSIIYFSSGFNNDTIELINGGKSLFKSPLETSSQADIAMIQTIDNTLDVTIKTSSPKPLVFSLNKEGLRNNKFVYISKSLYKKNKFTVQYTNELTYFR